MHIDYHDITSRITESPLWWDSDGVPRYDPFTHDLCPNIYAHQVVLLRIGCQHCWRTFDVEMNGDVFSPIRNPRELHYGDPPAHNCCGDSMNCDDLEVLEVWHRDENFTWMRVPDMEGRIT